LKFREDYLSSCIFGTIKYLNPEKALFPLLSHSYNYILKKTLGDYLKDTGIHFKDFAEAQLHFWPKSSAYGEPDIVLILEGKAGSFLLPIEVKYFSEKHGEGEEDQLMRYYLALATREGRETFDNEDLRNFSGKFMAFLYLTQFEGEAEIDSTLSILRKKGFDGTENVFFHLRWVDVTKIIKALESNESDLYAKRIFEDILKLLNYRNLAPFDGFSELPPKLRRRGLLSSPVFFARTVKSCDEYFRGFSPPHADLILSHKRTIFYGG
jgi:hypothetical protein